MSEIAPGTGLIDLQDSALVIIDMQDKLLAVMGERETCLENNVKLAKFARIVDMPVVATEQEKLGPTSQVISAEVDGWDPVMKIDFDATREPEFSDRVSGLGRKNLVVTGIESHICVTQTVLSLLPRYTVHVVSDAVDSRAPGNKAVALDRMRGAGAVVSSTEMVMYELLVRAGTPAFKEVLKLVK